MNRQLEEVRLSPEDYLEGEERGEIRHEYVAGSVYAMSGASEAHNLIAGNLFTALKLRLRGGPCRVFISDIKTRIEPQPRNGGQDCFYYPDSGEFQLDSVRLTLSLDSVYEDVAVPIDLSVNE